MTDNPYDPHPPAPRTPPGHCGRLDDHIPHEECVGGPMAAPGSVGRQPMDDAAGIELLAAKWREDHQDDARVDVRAFYEDSYKFARDALDQLKAAGVEMVVSPKRPDDAAP